MKKLSKINVKKTLTKLNLEIILRLLLSCKKDYQLFADNDVNSPRKELSIHRQALIDYIIDATNEDHEKIYKKAKAIAESLAEHDEKIQIIKEEIKPLQDELKDKKDRLKTLADKKELFTKDKVNELNATLDEVALNQLADYNDLVEKVADESQGKKQMKKTLKEVGKGFVAADKAEVTEEFGEAIIEATNVALSFVAKLRTRIKEHKEGELRLNNAIQELEKEWPTHETNIINKAKLNSDWKQAEEVPAQKLLMPAEGEALPIAA